MLSIRIRNKTCNLWEYVGWIFVRLEEVNFREIGGHSPERFFYNKGSCPNLSEWYIVPTNGKQTEWKCFVPVYVVQAFCQRLGWVSFHHQTSCQCHEHKSVYKEWKRMKRFYWGYIAIEEHIPGRQRIGIVVAFYSLKILGGKGLKNWQKVPKIWRMRNRLFE